MPSKNFEIRGILPLYGMNVERDLCKYLVQEMSKSIDNEIAKVVKKVNRKKRIFVLLKPVDFE